jgi:hypothetical protein
LIADGRLIREVSRSSLVSVTVCTVYCAHVCETCVATFLL